MARSSVLQRNIKRERLVARYATKRAGYKAIIKDMTRSEEERYAARVGLQRMPRDASPIRLRSRCAFHGRLRGVVQKVWLVPQ